MVENYSEFARDSRRAYQDIKEHMQLSQAENPYKLDVFFYRNQNLLRKSLATNQALINTQKIPC